MARTEKTIQALEWKQLAQNYFIGFRMETDLKKDHDGHIILDDNGHPIPQKVGRVVNELKDAVDSGELDAIVQECANTLHGGEVAEVYRALAKNLASKRYHLKNTANKETSAYKHDSIMFKTLESWLDSKVFESTGKAQGSSSGLPQWAYGPEQIDSLTSVEQLQKVINSIADVCANKAGAGVYSARLGADYIETAKQNRAYARQRKAELEAKENLDKVDPELLKKLTAGKKVSLSPEQAAALVRLLGNQ